MTVLWAVSAFLAKAVISMTDGANPEVAQLFSDLELIHELFLMVRQSVELAADVR